jgi:1-acyl-sn-glycerol-3-phosphate acyltransferase
MAVRARCASGSLSFLMATVYRTLVRRATRLGAYVQAIMLTRRSAPSGESEEYALTKDREPWFAIVRAATIPSMGLWFRWTVEGIENIPRSGPAILACNHISYLDPLAIGYVVLRAGRRPRFLAKSELFRDKRLGWLLRRTHQIEVQRGTARASAALSEASEALERGRIIVIFPEGTVTTDPDLRPMAAKSGAVRLAMTSRAPLVPCAVWGTANVWPKGRYEKRLRPRQQLLVRIGDPIDVQGSPDSRDEVRAAGHEIMERIGGLVASLRPIVPDDRRPLEASA